MSDPKYHRSALRDKWESDSREWVSSSLAELEEAGVRMVELELLPPGGAERGMGEVTWLFLAPDTGQSLTLNRGVCLLRCQTMIRDAWKTSGSHRSM